MSTTKGGQLSAQKVPWEPYKAAINNSNNTDDSQYKSYATSLNAIEELHLNKEHLVRYKISTDMSNFNSNRPGYQFDDLDLPSLDAANESAARPESLINELLVKRKLESIRAGKLQHRPAEAASEAASGDDESAETLTKVVGDESSSNRSNTSNKSEIQKLPPNFHDARLYSNTHFLKLANQLRRNCSVDEAEPTSAATTAAAAAAVTASSSVANKPVNVVGPMIEKRRLANLASASTSPYGIDNSSIRVWKSQQEQYEARISYLDSQMKGIYEQLQIQTQVNVELKKLLIASIGGEDMQYKWERLINDKLRYELELTSNAKVIDKLSEDVEQIAIQCDLWRSKFLASKLMAEENVTWKSFLLLLNRRSEQATKNLLEDNQLLSVKLNSALDLLTRHTERNSTTRHSSANTSSCGDNSNKGQRKRYNNMQAANLLLANAKALAGGELSDAAPSEQQQQQRVSSTREARTLSEISCAQLLEQFAWLKSVPTDEQHHQETVSGEHFVDSLERLERIIGQIKQARLSSHNRLYQSFNGSEHHLLLNFCNKCTGRIQIV